MRCTADLAVCQAGHAVQKINEKPVAPLPMQLQVQRMLLGSEHAPPGGAYASVKRACSLSLFPCNAT